LQENNEIEKKKDKKKAIKRMMTKLDIKIKML
jgi:hypothetical protein